MNELKIAKVMLAYVLGLVIGYFCPGFIILMFSCIIILLYSIWTLKGAKK